MSPSTVKRIGELYARCVGYNAVAEGEPAEDVLAILQEMRTALILCPEDPAAYVGPILKSKELRNR